MLRARRAVEAGGSISHVDAGTWSAVGAIPMAAAGPKSTAPGPPHNKGESLLHKIGAAFLGLGTDSALGVQAAREGNDPEDLERRPGWPGGGCGAAPGQCPLWAFGPWKRLYGGRWTPPVGKRPVSQTQTSPGWDPEG